MWLAGAGRGVEHPGKGKSQCPGFLRGAWNERGSSEPSGGASGAGREAPCCRLLRICTQRGKGSRKVPFSRKL